MSYALRLASILSLLLIIVLALIVGVPRIVYGAPKGNWLTWQSDSACEFSCWRGVVLGKTTLAEAYSILRRYPDFDPDEGEYLRRMVPYRDGSFLIRTPTGRIRGLMKLWTGKQILSSDIVTELSLEYEDSLSETIKLLGQPDQVVILKDNLYFSFYLSFGQKRVVTTSGGVVDGLPTVCRTGVENLVVRFIFMRNYDDPLPYQPWTGYDVLKKALCNIVQ